jgi:hypothetical protein
VDSKRFFERYQNAILIGKWKKGILEISLVGGKFEAWQKLGRA